jgi:ParB-like chromosome segregation protein Spo0J
MKWKKISVKLLKINPINPRTIKSKKFQQLVKSVKDFPEMLELRPIVVDSDLVVLGGNMRLKACIEAGFEIVPVIYADSLSDDQKKEFIIKDNLSFGEWETEDLALNWDVEQLKGWGFDEEIKEKLDIQEAEIEFSEYLGEANNYVVLKFDNEIDWLSAMTHFKLKSVYSQRANGKPWSKGIGRVINGAEYLNSLKNE